MLLDFEEEVRRRNLEVTGVLHIGAHFAEEAPVYERLGVPVLWVEANIDLRDRLENTLSRYIDQELFIGKVVTDVDGQEVDFNITNFDSMSSSVFEFGTHSTFSPTTVFVEKRKVMSVTIDNIMQGYDVDFAFNTLVMDIQGAELLALRGATDFLTQVDYVYCEVNLDEVYIGCAKLQDLVDFLGCDPVAVQLAQNDVGWGDALWVL